MKINHIKNQLINQKKTESSDSYKKIEALPEKRCEELNEKIKIGLTKIAEKKIECNSLTPEEIKEIVKILQSDNPLLAYLSEKKIEELNQLIAEQLMNDPILSSRLINLLNKLRR